MRTRHSARNQDRLFKELFKPLDPTPAPVVNRCGNCVHYPARGRSESTCRLLGQRVWGSGERECFRARSEAMRHE